MHRFTLEPYKSMASKHTCPKCGNKKVFKRYIDTEGEITFPDHVGKCDRENNCGYHFSPKQHFEDNPQKWEHREYSPQSLAPPKSTNYISAELVGKSFAHHRENNLFRFLSSQIGVEATDKLFAKYRVATAKFWKGATIFWQLDFKGCARTGKIMLYNPTTGRRVKEPHNHIQWAHKLIGREEYNLKQCFFGEHLLPSDTTKTVAIVESEKTALIASHYMPSFIWLATGGKNGCLKADNLEVLKGRKVVLCPDLGATEYWRSKIPLFTAKGIDVKLFDELENSATEEQRREGYDIADFLLDGNSPHSILQKIIELNPALKQLIERLDLELESVEKQ